MAQFTGRQHAEGGRRSPQEPYGPRQPQEPQWDPHALKDENKNELLQIMCQAMYGDTMVALDNSGIMLTEADIDTAPATSQDTAPTATSQDTAPAATSQDTALAATSQDTAPATNQMFFSPQQK